MNKVDHDHREPMHDMSHLNQEGMLQASQVMVQQLVEKGMLKVLFPSWTTLMVTHRLPRFHFMCGKNK